MATFQLRDAAPPKATNPPESPEPTSAPVHYMPVERRRDRLSAWGSEIASYFNTMKRLADMDPSDAFVHLAQFSARASEMRTQLGTHETKQEAAFRNRIIDPFLEECDRQFKIHSRIQAIREMDARLAGGNFA